MTLSFRAFLVVSAFFGPVYAALAGFGAVWSTTLLSLLVAVAGALLHWKPRSKILLWTAVAMIGISIGEHYGHTGTVIRTLQLRELDIVIADWERTLFGWLFLDGQISFWLDQHPILNPSAPVGAWITEFLQIMYFSYYFWGFGFLIWLTWRVHSATDSVFARHWLDLQRFVCAWVGGFYINFVCYILVPVVGPQFYFKDLYQHPIEGTTGLGLAIRTFIAENQATLQDCFPSGHTAMMWITAFMALRIVPRYGKIVLVAAALVTLSTVVLRYHYIIDLIAAIPLVLAGLAWGGIFNRRKTT